MVQDPLQFLEQFEAQSSQRPVKDKYRLWVRSFVSRRWPALLFVALLSAASVLGFAPKGTGGPVETVSILIATLPSPKGTPLHELVTREIQIAKKEFSAKERLLHLQLDDIERHGQILVAARDIVAGRPLRTTDFRYPPKTQALPSIRRPQVFTPKGTTP